MGEPLGSLRWSDDGHCKMTDVCSSCGQVLPQFGELVLEPEKLIICRGSLVAKLHPQEFEAVRFLISKRGRLARRDALWQWVHQLDHGGDEPAQKSLDIVICRVRKKLRPLGIQIVNVPREGYYAVAEDVPAQSLPAF